MNYLQNDFRIIEFRAERDLGNHTHFHLEKPCVLGKVLHLQEEKTVLPTSDSVFFFNKFIYILFIFDCVGSSSLHAGFRQLRRVVGYSSLWCAGFSLQWLLLLPSTGSRHAGFSSLALGLQSLWLMGSRAQTQQLWCTGLVALRHVGSSRTRARTRVPCAGRRILNHYATRKVPDSFYTPNPTCLGDFLPCIFPGAQRTNVSLLAFHPE